MVAKRFFYVCAGILCLALAYHFGAVRAEGQAAGFRILDSNNLLVGAAGTIYEIGPVGWRSYLGRGNTAPPVPVSSLVQYNGCSAVTEAGEGWQCNGNTGEWTSIGFLPGATPATHETWGGVKARYRPGAGAATQGK